MTKSYIRYEDKIKAVQITSDWFDIVPNPDHIVSNPNQRVITHPQRYVTVQTLHSDDALKVILKEMVVAHIGDWLVIGKNSMVSVISDNEFKSDYTPEQH